MPLIRSGHRHLVVARRLGCLGVFPKDIENFPFSPSRVLNSFRGANVNKNPFPHMYFMKLPRSSCAHGSSLLSRYISANNNGTRMLTLVISSNGHKR